MDEFEDSELSAALRDAPIEPAPRSTSGRRSSRSVAGPGAAGSATSSWPASVARPRWRLVAIGVGALTSDRDAVRTPATAPAETGAVATAADARRRQPPSARR